MLQGKRKSANISTHFRYFLNHFFNKSCIKSFENKLIATLKNTINCDSCQRFPTVPTQLFNQPHHSIHQPQSPNKSDSHLGDKYGL